MVKIIDDLSRTFSEYLLLPRLTKKTNVIDNTSLTTPICSFRKGQSPKINLNVPIVSAAMQTVSGNELAIELAKSGGLAFIYCSQSIESQTKMIAKVKAFKAGFVKSDSNVTPKTTLAELLTLMGRTGHSTVAVTNDGSDNGEFIGIITDNDFWRFEDNLSSCVEEFMTPVKDVVYGKIGISLTDANKQLRAHKKDCLPILSDGGRLNSLIFKKDYDEHMNNPFELLDSKKRLMAGAAVNTHDYKDRVPALVEAGVDVLCFDASDGFSQFQFEAIQWVRQEYGDEIVIGAGNVVSSEGFEYLAKECKADFVKVGIGGGSICITRGQKGIGRGQASAVMDVAKARDEYWDKEGVYVPICSDGGLSTDTQIIIALSMGADFVMMGRYFAMMDESPGNKVSIKGNMYKPYWGEGSFRARNWQRYSSSAQLNEEPTNTKILFEEGIDSYVAAIGPLKPILEVTTHKIRSTMVNTGVNNLEEFRKEAILTLVSQQSVNEGETSNVLINSGDLGHGEK